MTFSDKALEILGPHTSLEKVRRLEEAFLEVLREPTEAMLAAGRDPVWGFSQDYAPTALDPRGQNEDSAEYVARRTWQAMIDAALPHTEDRDA